MSVEQHEHQKKLDRERKMQKRRLRKIKPGSMGVLFPKPKKALLDVFIPLKLVSPDSIKSFVNDSEMYSVFPKLLMFKRKFKPVSFLKSNLYDIPKSAKK